MERQDLAMQSKNNKKYNILVSGASGIVGYGIVRALKKAGCNVIGTTIYDESPADCFADKVETAPITGTPGYVEWLIDTINKNNIDMIIPSIEADMNEWNKNREIISDATGTLVLLNNHDLIELCLDKWKFYNYVSNAGFKHCIATSIIPDSDRFNMPFILKPRCGYGSRGLVKVDSADVYEKYKAQIGEHLMMQEYVGNDNEEYTISAFFNKNSSMMAYNMLRRKLSKVGYTEIASTFYDSDLLKIISELADILKPVGPTNFQFRRHNGEWKLLEVNPRISSSTSIRTAFGYNESEMSVNYFLNNEDIKQPTMKSGKAIRYIEDYVIYDSNNI